VRFDGVAHQCDAVGEVVLPERGVPFGEGVAAPDVVHEDVQAAALVSDAADQGSHLIGVGVVDAYRDACPAGVVDEASRLLDCLAPRHGGAFDGGGATGHVDGGARRAELDGDAAAGPAGAAGDDGDPIVEVAWRVGHADNLLTVHS
jgi:hypothetical protein